MTQRPPHYGDPLGEQRRLAAALASAMVPPMSHTAGPRVDDNRRADDNRPATIDFPPPDQLPGIGQWAFEALRIAAGQPGPADVILPGETLAFLHLDGSDNVLPSAGDVVFLADDAVGRITSAANHYELGPIALAALKPPLPTSAAPLTVQVTESNVAHQIPASIQEQ